MNLVPLYTQHDAMDCGPTCLRMVAAYYGQRYSSQYMREKCFISRQGVSLLGISEAAEHIGMHTIGVQQPLEASIIGTPVYQRLLYVLKHPSERLTNEDWDALIRMVDEQLPTFRSTLYNCFPNIKWSDYQICLLVRLHFRPSEIATLIRRSQPYVTVNRRRMLTKFFREHGNGAEFDQRIREIKGKK
ncbi:MAG: hypothetical protein J6I31_04140 [Prevotella sp.]|nr:hypothetical protein [Prevotella sp.]